MVNPTIAIINGAGTPSSQYASLRTDFSLRDYPTVSHDPPSITAEDATSITVDNDITFIRDSVLAPLLSAGKNVVLLCHSYGGAYGASAIRGLSFRERAARGESGGVLGIIYIASFCVAPGESALQALGIGSEIPEWVGSGEKPGTLMFTDAQKIWPSLPTHKAEARLKEMLPVAVGAVGTAVSYAPYDDVNYVGSVAYVWGEYDTIVTPDVRQASLNKSGIELVRSFQGGHGIDIEGREHILGVVVEIAEHFMGIAGLLKDSNAILI